MPGITHAIFYDVTEKALVRHAFMHACVTAADEEIDVIYIPEVEWNASKERFLSFARPRMTVEFVVDS